MRERGPAEGRQGGKAAACGASGRVGAARPQVRRVSLSRSFDGDDFDDVEEDEGLEDLENAEEVGAPCAARRAAPQPGRAAAEASVAPPAPQGLGGG